MGQDKTFEISILSHESRMSLRRSILKGVNHLHKSVVRFKSTTSAESSSPRDEALNLKELLKNMVSIVTSQSSKDVANAVAICTGFAGALLIAWEFFSIGQLKVEFAGMRQDIVHQTGRIDKQTERIDKVFETLMTQTTDNQKQFAFLVKENAEASKKADERYFELLNALKK